MGRKPSEIVRRGSTAYHVGNYTRRFIPRPCRPDTYKKVCVQCVSFPLGSSFQLLPEGTRRRSKGVRFAVSALEKPLPKPFGESL
jgi:hypothetical protein